MRDWIAQATEADLADLETLLAAGPDPAGRPAQKWTAATLGEVAAFLGVQLQTVKEWRTGPDPMPGQEGAYPLPEIVRWRFAKLQFLARPAGGKAAKEEISLEIHNARDLLKLRNESGELVSREAAKTAVRQLFHRLRGQIQPLPDILASAVPNANRADFLFDARNRIQLLLTSIANWQFDAEVTPDQPAEKNDGNDTAKPAGDPAVRSGRQTAAGV